MFTLEWRYQVRRFSGASDSVTTMKKSSCLMLPLASSAVISTWKIPAVVVGNSSSGCRYRCQHLPTTVTTGIGSPSQASVAVTSKHTSSAAITYIQFYMDIL